MSARYRIGTRGSPLALAQAEEVVSRLRDGFPSAVFEVTPMTTGGDRRKDAALVSLGRGAFAKDIEMALLNGDIDLAVHSAKDLASELPEGLVIAGSVPRQDPRDALIDRWAAPLSELPPGARIGTGSPRRTALLKSLRPDIEVVPIRGNVGTRVGKVGGPECDGVVVAAAGLARLGRIAEAHELFPAETFVPDAGQGTLAIEARSGDLRCSRWSRPSTTAPPAPPWRPSGRSFAASEGAARSPWPHTPVSQAMAGSGSTAWSPLPMAHGCSAARCRRRPTHLPSLARGSPLC